MKLTLTRRIELLEEQQALTVELCRRVLEGRWTGGAESAEALLLAISPALEGELRALPFPGPGAEPPRVAILNTEGEDIRPMLEAAVEGTAVPLELALACAIAESGLNPRAERWGGHTGTAKDAIATWDMEVLQEIINRAGLDVGFGYAQRIVAYHWAGDESMDLENVLAVREAVFADPARDLREMALKLQDCLDLAGPGDRLLDALVVYNAGHLPGLGDPWWTRWAGNVEGYRAALARARELLGG